MTKKDTEKRPNSRPPVALAATKSKRPLAGFFIAGASLAVLFGLAALKGRVKDDN
jgi:hypothetical protein